ncbi:MAG: membrane lipoprotein lipid attachment site-containing protein [Chloroflexi bacterium]|nr:membrane lipoprotein lipid attachment site-containing protein [Chloroflexota bacterium]
MKKFFFVLMILFLLSGCGSASVSPTPALPTLIPPSPAPFTPVSGGVPTSEAIPPEATPVCISFEPTQADIDRALEFTGKLFERLDWQRSYTVAEGRVTVTWFSETLAAVGFLEALIFPCGYEELDLDYYFNVDNWTVVFGNYESYRLVNDCRTDDGTRLYQFRTVEQGYEYDARYWTVSDTDARVIAMMLVFPVETPQVANEYAYSLFPQLTNCP